MSASPAGREAAPPAARGREAPATQPRQQDPFAPDMDAEFDMGLSDASFDALMCGGACAAMRKSSSRSRDTRGRVVAVRRDEVFVELGGREQGCVPLRQFATPPKPGDAVEVVVQRLNADDGLYDLRLPEAAADVADWGDLPKGCWSRPRSPATTRAAWSARSTTSAASFPSARSRSTASRTWRSSSASG